MPEPKVTVPAIYGDMIAAQLELAKEGIAKTRQNVAQNFAFRGIDEILNTVSPILAKHGILTLAKYLDYPDIERVTGKGTTLIYIKVRGDYTLISVKDGSHVEVTTFGVAMDSGDKAMNKAQTMALKAALLQTFLIPTQGDGDADADTPEETSTPAPEGFGEWFDSVVDVSLEGIDALKAVWRDSPEPFRQHAMKYRADAWDTAKKKAIGITNAAKPKKAAKP